MKTLIILLLSITLMYAEANEPVKKQLLSPDASLALLDTIKDKAIVFGSGPKEVHTFIDPLCSMSRLYLSFLFKKKDVMFKKYTIYLYLYELDGKNSSSTIHTILSSKYKDTMLKSVMLNKEELPTQEESDESDEAVEEIAQIAKKIGVYKRPYIMMNGKVK